MGVLRNNEGIPLDLSLGVHPILGGGRRLRAEELSRLQVELALENVGQALH